MFLALFFFPWMLMYALSTAAMNHRAAFAGVYGEGPVPFERERRFTYDGTFPDAAEPRDVARQLLSSLDLDGAHGVSRRDDGTIVITRQDLLAPRRVTYSPADRSVLIERLQHRPNALLERFHRRRGYATGYALDTAWAVSVDLVIAAMLFWVASGLWMWWEMKATRRLGAAALLTGAGLFAIFLATL
jgi:hypothetical protein